MAKEASLRVQCCRGMRRGDCAGLLQKRIVDSGCGGCCCGVCGTDDVGTLHLPRGAPFGRRLDKTPSGLRMTV